MNPLPSVRDLLPHLRATNLRAIERFAPGILGPLHDRAASLMLVPYIVLRFMRSYALRLDTLPEHLSMSPSPLYRDASL